MGVGISRDPIDAQIRAAFEAIERSCLEGPLPSRPILASFSDVQENAVDPALLCNFGDDDVPGRSRARYIDVLRKTSLAWIWADRLPEGTRTLIPVQLVYLHHLCDEPLIRPQISTGAAAHTCLDLAVLNGIFECIERDAYMLHYLPSSSPALVNPCGRTAGMFDYFARYRLDVQLFDITTDDIQIPAYVCLNVDRTGNGPAVAVGLASGTNPELIMEKAILESQQVRQWIRYLHVSRRIPTKNASGRSVTTEYERAALWYDISSLSPLALLASTKTAQSSSLPPALSPKPTLDSLVEHLNGCSISVYVADITTPSFENAGLSVVKVIAPELHPLYLSEATPCRFSARLNHRLKGTRVNTYPHPFL